MSDEDFLNWVADRFVEVYGESENTDFIHHLRSMAKYGGLDAFLKHVYDYHDQVPGNDLCSTCVAYRSGVRLGPRRAYRGVY